MDLRQVSYNIDLVKKDTAQWLHYADALIKGQSLSKNAVPKYRDDCNACSWLYEHSKEVDRQYNQTEYQELELFDFDIIEQVEILRYDMQEHYLQLFNTYLPEINNAFFANLFRSEQIVSEYDRINAKRQLFEMRVIVSELNKKLDYLEASLFDCCRLNIA